MDNIIQVTLMRHGRSRADDEMVHEGRYDSPLTDVGQAQVEATTERWKCSPVTFDLIISSTLVRASESARIVSEALGVPVEYDADWMERDNGPLAGLPFEVARAKYPRPDFAGPFEPYIPSERQGESGWDLHTRAARALQRVVRRGRGSYLVVAHGGIINAAIFCILGIPPPATTSGVRFAMGDACFIRAAYDAEKHLCTILEMTAQQSD